MPTPILLLSDAPDSGTGLGRIAKDLAALLSTMPEFRVGTLGRGGHGSRKLPWIQYTFDERLQWGEEILPAIWKDFAGDGDGVIFTIWDASRLSWFSLPEYLPEGPTKTLLMGNNIRRWGYFPVDSHGPEQRLSIMSQAVLGGYDRILAYSKYGKRVLENSVVPTEAGIDFIPHGLDLDVFYPKDISSGRKYLGVNDTVTLIGCVMTNQARKDWGVWAQTARKLLDINPEYMFWVHIDILERYWSLPALIADFYLANNVKVTQNLSDEVLAELYSACDLTILPSLGEGFGYPIAESLACGTPVIHHDHAAGHEIMPTYGQEQAMNIPGIIRTGVLEGCNYRLDTLHNIYRPVLDPQEWANEILSFDYNRPSSLIEATEAVKHLSWGNLAPVWKNWFRSGLGQ